jgi:hypothetical protein
MLELPEKHLQSESVAWEWTPVLAKESTCEWA